MTNDESVAAVKELMNDPGFSPLYDRVIDARGVTEVKLTKGNLMDLAVIDPVYPSERRAVVTSSAAVFGMGRMFGLISGKEEQGTYRVFMDYEKAIDWINEPRPSKKPHSTMKIAR